MQQTAAAQNLCDVSDPMFHVIQCIFLKRRNPQIYVIYRCFNESTLTTNAYEIGITLFIGKE